MREPGYYWVLIDNKWEIAKSIISRGDDFWVLAEQDVEDQQFKAERIAKVGPKIEPPSES